MEDGGDPHILHRRVNQEDPPIYTPAGGHLPLCVSLGAARVFWRVIWWRRHWRNELLALDHALQDGVLGGETLQVDGCGSVGRQLRERETII